MKNSLSLIITAVLITSIMTTCLVLGYSAVNQVRQQIITEYKASGEASLKLWQAILDRQYPGEWSLQNGELFKGQTLINNQFVTVDEMGKATFNLYTIFAEDIRVSTNVQNNGQRAVGTKASDAVTNTVLKEGRNYIGPADILGTPHYTLYIPLLDSGGRRIGMLFTGIPMSSLEGVVARITRNIAIWGLVIACITVSMAYLIIRNTIISPIQHINSGIAHITAGDLTVQTEIKSRTEIGALSSNVNAMTAELRALVSGIFALASDLGAHSEELAAASQEVAASAQEMASTSSQVAASVEEGSASTSDVANTANAMMADASIGTKAAQESLSAINVVLQMSSDNAKTMESLQNETAEIGSITEHIRDIADQTNLLALNAAIEAARAGEHGRGFAVVAEAVRHLAQQSATATRDINEIVKRVAGGAKRAAEAVTKTNAAINDAENKVEAAGNTLRQISDKVTDLSKAIAEVAVGSNEASQGAEQLAASVQEISSTSQEMASAAQSLANMAERVQREIAKFTV